MTRTDGYRGLLVLGLTLGLAQGVSTAGEVSNENAAVHERASIEETRRVQTEILDARATECRQKFATTHCLNQVSSERLKLQSKLKQREEVLNDAERRKRGLEQTERSQEKAQAHAQKMASIASAPEPRASLPKPLPLPGGTPSARGGPEAKSALTEQQRSDNARDYDRKQAQALAKRAEVAKRVLEKGAPQAPLPRPGQ